MAGRRSFLSHPRSTNRYVGASGALASAASGALSPDERSHFPFFTENSVALSACCGDGVFRASGSFVACRLSHSLISFPWLGRRSVCCVHPDALPHIVQPALVRRVSDSMALVTCSNLTHSFPLPPRPQTPPPPPPTPPPPPESTLPLMFPLPQLRFHAG